MQDFFQILQINIFITFSAASQTYVSRKSQAGESVHLCEMEKSAYQRPVSRADPIYYPTPYATTHIADGPCRKSFEAAEREVGNLFQQIILLISIVTVKFIYFYLQMTYKNIYN